MAVAVQEVADGVLKVYLTGKLIAGDYEHFNREVERVIGEHGKVRMLVELRDFHGWTMGAMWEDIKFDLKHFNHIDRLALVGETKWEQGMATFCKPFTTATIRYFDHSKEAEAETWIREGLSTAATT